VQNFTQALYGESITSILSLQQRGELKPSKGLQKLLSMLKGVLGGKKYEKRIKLEKLIEMIGDETTAMVEFVVFILQNPDAENKIERGYCNPKYIKIDRGTALRLYGLVRIERLLELIKTYTNLYKLYESYLLCKVCRILGLRYRDDVVQIGRIETSAISTDEVLCDCMDLCGGKHVDDVEKAKALMLYAKRNPSAKIYVATVASVTTPEKFHHECFSCLAKCIEKKVNNTVVLQ